MLALSIRQPWVEAILRLGKRVENRAWKGCRRDVIGQVIALHAAQGDTREEYFAACAWMEERGLAARAGGELLTRSSYLPDVPWWESLHRGAVVGRARIVAAQRTDALGHRVTAHGCALCGPLPSGLREPCTKPDPWGIPDTLGLVLADVVALRQPIPCRGQLGFFELPEDVARLAA